MATKFLFQSILVLLVISEVKPQFFDIFQDIQPLFQTQRNFLPTRPFVSTKRPEASNSQNYNYNNENTNNDELVRNQKQKLRNRQSTTYADFFTTTLRTTRNHRTESSQQYSYNHNSRINDRNDNSKKNIINNNRPYNNDNIYTTRPYDVDNYFNSRENNERLNNRYETTQRGFYSRPGVKPIKVDNRPPITNKPKSTTTNFWTTEGTTRKPFWTTTRRPIWDQTERPVWTIKGPDRPSISNRITQKPVNVDVITFPDNKDKNPEFSLGPDVDSLSRTEKRRLVEKSERMCDVYKSLNTKQLQAIPLVPSPQPLEVNVTACTPNTVPLVVGGKVVSIKQFPHMALLGWSKLDEEGYSWKCGGSLVSDQFVLTAAHCAYQERDNTVISGPPRAVQLGSSYLGDARSKVVKIGAVIKHPKYKAPKSYNDLAVVKMLSKVTFSEFIKPACLGVPPNEGDHIIATGWGRTEFGGDQSLELRSVSLPVWSIEECSQVLGISRKLPEGPSRDSQICAGVRSGGKDTCQGDSGGPAQVQDGCVWRVVAVTSLGRSCGAVQTPGLYATAQIPFIAAIVFGGPDITNNNNNRALGNGKTENRPDYYDNKPPNNDNRESFNNNNDNRAPGNGRTENRPNNYDNKPANNDNKESFNKRRPAGNDDSTSNNDNNPSNYDYSPENNEKRQTAYNYSPSTNVRPASDIYKPAIYTYKPANNNRRSSTDDSVWSKPHADNYNPSNSNNYKTQINNYKQSSTDQKSTGSTNRQTSNNFKQDNDLRSSNINRRLETSIRENVYKAKESNSFTNYQPDQNRRNNLYHNEMRDYNNERDNVNEKKDNYNSFYNNRKNDMFANVYGNIDYSNDPPAWS